MKLQKKTDLLEYMLSVSQAMAEKRTLTPLLSFSIDEVLALVGAKSGYIVLLKEDGTLDFQVKQYANGQAITKEADPTSHSILDEAIQTKKSVLVRNAQRDPRFASSQSILIKRKRSIMCVPLIIKTRVIGAIYVENRSKQDQFNEEDLVPLEFFSRQAAVAIENAFLNDNLEHLIEVRTHQLALAKEVAEKAQKETEVANHDLTIVNRALITSNAGLEISNAELKSFAHTVAHDLKNPLSIVLGFSEIVFADCDKLSVPEIREFIDIINKTGNKMANIINELLLLASVRQLDEVAIEPLNMSLIVEEANSRLQNIISEYGGKIALPESWPVAVGYSPWVEEIWVNYISNALKYGGTPPILELGTHSKEDGFVYFWIKDNGSGLSREAQTQLFMPFTRLHETRAQGHGLGLSIVQRIAEKLGGTVGVESNLGQGSTFFFTLPLGS